MQAVEKWLIVLLRKHSEWGIGQPLPVHKEAFGRQSTAFRTVCGSDLDDLLFTKVFNFNKYIQRVSIPFNNSSTHICPVSAEVCIGF
jgi:hypothetical protein